MQGNNENIMLISVIIPVFNAERYLDRCIKSIIEQTYKNLEIIIVNDGSTDASPEICEKWQKIDNRIILINQLNSGQGIARNQGIRNSRGQYLAFVDADDWIDVTALEKTVQALNRTKADIILFNLYCVHTYNDEIVEYEPVRNQCCTGKCFSFYEDCSLFYKVSGCLWDALWNRDCFYNIDMPSHAYEDELTVIRIYSMGYKIYCLNEYLYYYNLYNMDNTTHKADSVNGLEASFIEMKNYLGAHKFFGLIYPMLRVRVLSIYRALIQNIFDVCEDRDKLIPMLSARAERFMEREFPDKTYRLFDNKRCLLIGSYNLRLITKRAFDIKNSSIDDYAMSSIISCMNRKGTINDKLFIVSNSTYEQDMINKDRDNSLLELLEKETGDTYEYVLFDMLEELSDIICYKENYYTDNDGLSTLLGDDEMQLVECGSDDYFELWKQAAVKLLNRLLIVYDARQIIMIKNFCNYDIIELGDMKYSEHSDDRYRILMNEEYEPLIMRKKISEALYSCKEKLICGRYINIDEIQKHNLWLDLLYSYIEIHYPEINVITIPDEYSGTDKYFPVGIRPEYFNEAYYIQAADNIRMIDCMNILKGGHTHDKV